MDASSPLQMGVRAGLCAPTWLPPSCTSLTVRCGTGGGVSGGRRGGGDGSGMSGAHLVRSASLASRSRLPLSFRGLMSLARALAPDHWLFLTTTMTSGHVSGRRSRQEGVLE